MRSLSKLRSSLSEIMGTQMNTSNPLTICSNSHTQTDKSKEPKTKKTSLFLLKETANELKKKVPPVYNGAISPGQKW
jgi:hypothetical protein